MLKTKTQCDLAPENPTLMDVIHNYSFLTFQVQYALDRNCCSGPPCQAIGNKEVFFSSLCAARGALTPIPSPHHLM